ncbi:MAG: ATP-binding protein [Fidelibacterota bacterium]
MFNREILDDLRDWARADDRKPLILRGARQVGKTTAVNIFSREFDQYLYLDLENSEDAEIFARDLPFQDLVQAMFLHKNLSPSDGRTLLFVDEIQGSPIAIKMMRYFRETAHTLFVLAAGSLLEATFGAQQMSFPVGRVQFIFMYPLTFREFLVATGEDKARQLLDTVPLPTYAFTRLLNLFHQYTLIGGMPEIVGCWNDSRDVTALTPMYEALMTSYRDDVVKYARNRTMVEILRHTIESVPLETGKRITFEGFGNSRYRSREMSEALKSLERALLLHLVYPTTVTKPPIRIDKRKKPRLQFLDTGLINYTAGLQRDFFTGNNLHAIYHGMIVEHVVGQELIAMNRKQPGKISFWVRQKKQSTAEVDYVLPHGQFLIPVEVKAGKVGTLRSLHQFMERVDHRYAVRIYAGQLKKTENQTPNGKRFTLLDLPYFLSGKLTDYLNWFIH